MDTEIIKTQIAFSTNESVDSVEKKIESILTEIELAIYLIIQSLKTCFI